MYIKVAVYIRKSGTREYEKASPRANYPSGTIFCLRYTQGGKRKHLGWFKIEADAARAYNAKARELFGEFAYLNEIPDEGEGKGGVPPPSTNELPLVE